MKISYLFRRQVENFCTQLHDGREGFPEMPLLLAKMEPSSGVSEESSVDVHRNPS